MKILNYIPKGLGMDRDAKRGVETVLPLIPYTDPLKYTELAVSNVATVLTLESNTSFVEIQGGDSYPCRFRRLTLTDTTACNANNAHGRIPAGNTRHYGLKANTANISFLATGTDTITIIQW